ncbi:MAG TPA: DUF4097 family beta strand repeat-containing protein [Thermoanaerobaculia bacterium]|nr:DUF4097 family beta strand repeat-containing protein [Thermoanaerobaculia bacterium]
MRYALFSLALIASAARADVSRTVAASVRRGAVKRVIVSIPAGEITVRNGSADRINVSGEVQRNDDDENIRNLNIEIATDGDDAIIRKTGGSDWGWRVHTNYHLNIDVPRGMSVNLETKYGEITIEGEFGNIDVDLRAGEIHLRTPRSLVKELNASARIGEVHTDFGDDREDHEGILPGTTHFINANGRSRINVHTTVGELHVTLTR